MDIIWGMGCGGCILIRFFFSLGVGVELVRGFLLFV